MSDADRDADTERIDWLQKNGSGFAEDVGSVFELTWIGSRGEERRTRGANLRACVDEAARQGGAT